jgi:hypothetical protein
MAVVSVSEMRHGGCSIRSAKGVPVLDETYHLLVLTDSKSTTRVDVLNHANVPKVNVTAASGGLSICKSVIAERSAENPIIWEVTAEFSSEIEEGQGGGDPSSNPAEWVPIYETRYERIQEVVTRDYAGTAVANSAGQPFESGIVRTRMIPVWSLFQFEPATVTDEQILERCEKVNSDQFRGRAAHTLLLIVESSVIGYFYGSLLRFTQYSLKYNEKTWKQKRLDVGTVYLDSGQHKPYTDSEGNLILGGLNGSGAKVTTGQPPAVLEFELYEAISFSFLRHA